MNSNLWTFPFDNNLKRTINSAVIRANMHERSTHRILRRAGSPERVAVTVFAGRLKPGFPYFQIFPRSGISGIVDEKSGDLVYLGTF